MHIIFLHFLLFQTQTQPIGFKWLVTLIIITKSQIIFRSTFFPHVVSSFLKQFKSKLQFLYIYRTVHLNRQIDRRIFGIQRITEKWEGYNQQNYSEIKELNFNLESLLNSTPSVCKFIPLIWTSFWWDELDIYLYLILNTNGCPQIVKMEFSSSSITMELPFSSHYVIKNVITSGVSVKSRNSDCSSAFSHINGPFQSISSICH